MVAGDLVLVGSCAGTLYAFERDTGDVRWSYDTNALDGYTANFHGQPLISEGTLIIGTDSADTGYLYSFDLKTGEPRWKLEIEEGVATNILRVGDSVIAVTLSDRVLGLGFDDGRLLWSHTGGILQSAEVYREAEFHWTASPVTDGERVFVGGLDGFVRAVEPTKGTARWSTDLKARVSAHPLLIGEGLYVGTEDGILHRLKPETGELLASLPLDDKPMWQLTPIGDALLALLNGAVTFVAVDLELSRELWQADAEETWTSFRPLPWNGSVLVGDSQGDLFALDPSSGRPKWSRHLGGELRGIGADETTLYVGNLAGMIRAWRPAGD